MAKTIRDYLLKGGVKGRTFVDKIFPATHTVTDIRLLGRGQQRTTLTIEGKTLEGDDYSKSLDLCLDHKEYSQTSPKCTGNLRLKG